LSKANTTGIDHFLEGEGGAIHEGSV